MKPRVAMLAYACDPLGSGEHWLGWGWAETAAQFCEVTLFAPPKARAAIEQHALRAGITPRFVQLPRWLRWCSERLGTAGSWWRKIAWARQTARVLARESDAFDLIHHTTFHTFRVPFYSASLGLPSVWGPIAGGESTPPGFDDFLFSAASSEKKRAAQNRRWLAWARVQRALRDTGAIFVSNRTTLEFLPEFARAKCTIVPPNTVRTGDESRVRSHLTEPGRLRLIYAGNCVATRCLPLVLRALGGLDRTTLVVAGDGPAIDEWRRIAAPLLDRVTFAGKVGREQLAGLYDEADALVFPALRDSGGSALLEAMSLGLPVVCLDWAGPGEMVGDGSGLKIPVHSPEQVIQDLRAAFVRLRDDATLAPRLAAAAAARVRSHFTWAAKRRVLEETYAAVSREK